MTTRDQYVTHLHEQLDRWNADMARWEQNARGARKEIKERCDKELDVLRAQRELANYNLKLLEAASASAWTELRHGADDAWKRMAAAVEAARTHFEAKRP